LTCSPVSYLPLSGGTITGDLSVTGTLAAGTEVLTAPSGQYALTATGSDYAGAEIINNHTNTIIGSPAEYALLVKENLSASAYRGYAIESAIYANPFVSNNHLIPIVTTAYANSLATTDSVYGVVAQMVDQTTETGQMPGEGFRCEGGGAGQPKWESCLSPADGSVVWAMLVGAADATSPSGGDGSQAVSYGHWNSSGAYEYVGQTQADIAGDLVIMPGTAVNTAQLILYGGETLTNGLTLGQAPGATGAHSSPLETLYSMTSGSTLTGATLQADSSGNLNINTNIAGSAANVAITGTVSASLGWSGIFNVGTTHVAQAAAGSSQPSNATYYYYTPSSGPQSSIYVVTDDTGLFQIVGNGANVNGGSLGISSGSLYASQNVVAQTGAFINAQGTVIPPAATGYTGTAASNVALSASPTFTGTVTGPTFNATTGFSANGTAGVTGSTCTAWSEGLCTHL
jgi:hypothetical protein